MTQHPMITDRSALIARRKRHVPDALFLHAAAADEIDDRMKMVKKSFTKMAIVTGFPDFWAQRFSGAELLEDADTLDLEPASQDLVVHALSLHWANDPVGQMIQCRRALKPDGLFLAVCFGGQTLSELRTCLAEAEIKVTGGLSPRVAPMADLRDLGALLQRAGLALPVADTQTVDVAYDDAWHLMKDLRAMGEANALSDRLRQVSRRTIFEHAANLYMQNFATEGRILATFELVYLAGWAPHESQQKPLSPGSAQLSLADALGVTETKLPN